MDEHTCKGNLESITKSKFNWKDALCGEIAPYIEVYACYNCNSLFYKANPGIEDINQKLQKQKYLGNLKIGELKEIIPGLKYIEALSLLQNTTSENI